MVLGKGEIFLYTFIWFQIGLSHNHKHSETPWYFNAFKITSAFKNKIHLGSVLKQNRERTGKILAVVFWVRREAPDLNVPYPREPSPQCGQSVALEAKTLKIIGPVNRKRVELLAGQGACPHPVNVLCLSR